MIFNCISMNAVRCCGVSINAKNEIWMRGGHFFYFYFDVTKTQLQWLIMTFRTIKQLAFHQASKKLFS